MTRHARDERGAVVIITALCMVAVLLMAAIVIDLGSTRSVRREARAAADAAATAGTLELATGSAASCATAFSYAFTNLGGTPPSVGQTTSACASGTNGGLVGACTPGGPSRVATFTDTAGRTVQVTNPVPDGDPLLRATAVGGGVNQPAGSAIDGSDCQRLGVEITQPQSRFFGGVASSAPRSFSVHSVARYRPQVRKALAPPAAVALNQRACRAIDAGTGEISMEPTPVGPAIIYSDSDGSNPPCSASQGILNTSSSGSIRAAAKSPTEPGQLGWYVPPPPATAGRGYVSGRTTLENGTTSSPYSYVGKLVGRTSRTTRAPADERFHCSATPVTPLTPLCTTTDPVKEADLLAGAASAPVGYATSSTCSTSAAPVTFSSDTFVNCPLFEVKGNPLVVTNGATIIFKGALAVAANGTLAVNVSSTVTPAVGASGLPISSSPVQSRLIVGSNAANAVNIGSNSAAIYMAETFLYSRGGFNLSSLNKLLWSPPSAGPSEGLLYWSEAASAFSIQGGPSLKAAGVLFHGNGPLTGGGGGLIDLSHVQLWVDTIAIGGSTKIKLSPDPIHSISVGQPGSVLIR